MAITPEQNRINTRIHYWADSLGLDVIKNRGTWTLVNPQSNSGPEILAYRFDSAQMAQLLLDMRAQRASAA